MTMESRSSSPSPGQSGQDADDDAADLNDVMMGVVNVDVDDPEVSDSEAVAHGSEAMQDDADADDEVNRGLGCGGDAASSSSGSRTCTNEPASSSYYNRLVFCALHRLTDLIFMDLSYVKL